METEIWEDIPGYEGLYSVSTLGDIITKRKGRKLSKLHDKDGYLFCALSFKNKQKTMRINRAVAITFIPNPENKPQVNHKNGINTDNRIENLEWVTDKENKQHSHRVLRTIKNYQGVKVSQYTKSGELIKTFYNIAQAHRELGINNIYAVLSGRTKTAGGFKWKKYDTI